MGPCQCDACQTRYRARYGRPVPAAADHVGFAFIKIQSMEDTTYECGPCHGSTCTKWSSPCPPADRI
jgi:hypothetical protein